MFRKKKLVITRKSNYMGAYRHKCKVEKTFKTEQKMVVVHPKEKFAKEQGENMERFNIQLFAEEAGADAPNTDTQTQIDYESEYRKMLAERDAFKAEAEKQKGLKDKYASENAGYKKKELEKMTDDEKKAKEYQELVEAKNQMAEEIRTMKLERDLFANGFTAEESAKLVSSNFAIGDIKILTDIIKVRVEEAVKSAKAEGLKSSVQSSPMGNGTADGKVEKTPFQKFQEERNKNISKKEVKFN